MNALNSLVLPQDPISPPSKERLHELALVLRSLNEKYRELQSAINSHTASDEQVHVLNMQYLNLARILSESAGSYVKVLNEVA